MINLVKNEFVKIIKKKSTLILMLFIIGIVTFGNIMDKVSYDEEGNNKNRYYYSYSTAIDGPNPSEEIKKLDKNKDSDKPQYLSLLTQIDIQELIEKYSNNEYNWKNTFIYTYLYEIVNELNTAKVYNIILEDMSSITGKYDRYIKILEDNDENAYSDLIISDLQNEKVELEKQLKLANETDKKAMDIKLEEINMSIKLENLRKTYSYGFDSSKWGSEYIDRINGYMSGILTQRNTEFKTKSEENDYNSMVKQVSLLLKSLEDNRNYLQENTMSAELVNLSSHSEILIMMLGVVIAGGIIASEFSRGTIKMLLIRPYKRWKILVSKYIAIMITMLLAILITIILQLILGIILFGLSTLYMNTAVYSFKASQVVMINTFAYMFINFGLVFVKFVLITTLATALSTMFKSSALAISLPLLGYTMYQMIEMLAVAYNLEWLKYFISLNWDLNNFLFGANFANFDITLPFAIAICIVYELIMIVPTVIIFSKTDVKNQ